MARAYLQGQGQEREPEPACLDGPSRYRYSQEQGHQYHHHHVPLADDVHHSPPDPRSARWEEHQGGRWLARRRKPVE